MWLPQFGVCRGVSHRIGRAVTNRSSSLPLVSSCSSSLLSGQFGETPTLFRLADMRLGCSPEFPLPHRTDLVVLMSLASTITDALLETRIVRGPFF